MQCVTLVAHSCKGGKALTQNQQQIKQFNILFHLLIAKLCINCNTLINMLSKIPITQHHTPSHGFLSEHKPAFLYNTLVMSTSSQAADWPDSSLSVSKCHLFYWNWTNASLYVWCTQQQGEWSSRRNVRYKSFCKTLPSLLWQNRGVTRY